MVWLFLLVRFFLTVITFTARLWERALWNLLLGCWQSQLSKFLKNHSAKAVRDVRSAPCDSFPTAVLRRWWCLPAAREPSASTTAVSQQVPVNRVPWAVLWGMLACRAICLWGQDDISLLNSVFLGFLKGLDHNLTLKICYPRDLVGDFGCLTWLTFLHFLAENYICASGPLQEVMKTVGPNFFQTWGKKQKIS